MNYKNPPYQLIQVFLLEGRAIVGLGQRQGELLPLSVCFYPRVPMAEFLGKQPRKR